jgi:hypothetical protein
MEASEQMISDHRPPLFETRFLSDGPQEFPRKYPRSVRVLIVLVGSGLGWGIAIGLVVMAMEWVR